MIVGIKEGLGYYLVRAAYMTVLGRLLIHWLRQLEVADDSRRTKVKQLTYDLGYLGIVHVHLRGAESVDIQRDRTGYTDGVTNLNQHLVRYTCCHQMFGNPTCRISS